MKTSNSELESLVETTFWNAVKAAVYNEANNKVNCRTTRNPLGSFCEEEFKRFLYLKTSDDDWGNCKKLQWRVPLITILQMFTFTLLKIIWTSCKRYIFSKAFEIGKAPLYSLLRALTFKSVYFKPISAYIRFQF